MKKAIRLAISLVLAAGLPLSPAFAEEAAGIWHGKLMGQLNILIRIEKDATGYKGVLESPDQARFKTALDTVSATPDTLSFAVTRINGRYEGRWDETQKAWIGTWTQGAELPLELKRIDEAQAAAFDRKRPQVDAAQAALSQYHVEAVSLPTSDTGVTLAGTYSAPKGEGPFPAVVLIAGSGPNTRDEDVFGHKVFLVLADALNRAGIAVLRYDKRGVGASTGHYAQATTADFANDAEAAARWLSARKDVKTIGLIGHSEGGIIAPIVANRDPKVAFVVLLAGSGVRGDRLLLSQQESIGRASGLSENVLSQAAAANRLIYDAIIADPAHADAAARAVVEAQKTPDHPQDPKTVDAIIKQITTPWMVHFLSYDPQPELKKLKTPVLALIGEKDLQVPADENLPALRDALKDNKDATVSELPGLNHMFQTATTGAPSEYAETEETIAPSALKLITDWIRARTK